MTDFSSLFIFPFDYGITKPTDWNICDPLEYNKTILSFSYTYFLNIERQMENQIKTWKLLGRITGVDYKTTVRN